MSLFLRFTLLLSAILFSSQIGESNRPLLYCKPVDRAPIIDGILEDRCWIFADRATGFWQLHNGGLATEQTEVRVAYDSEYLYVAVRCEESRPDLMRTRFLGHDSQIWLDDCVEIFLDTNLDHKTYYHVISNAAAARYEEYGFHNYQAWNPEWLVAADVQDDYWTLEMAIPFSSMNVNAPSPNTIWGFNANRQQWAPSEQSSWAETRNSFHEPAAFGQLIFVPIF